MVGTIRLFEVLKTRFGDEEARFVVEEIEKIEAGVEAKAEKIEAGVEAKIEKAFDRKKDVLATKFDIVNLKEDFANLRGELKEEIATMRIEMERGFKDNLKWTVGTIIACAAIIIALSKLIH